MVMRSSLWRGEDFRSSLCGGAGRSGLVVGGDVSGVVL